MVGWLDLSICESMYYVEFKANVQLQFYLLILFCVVSKLIDDSVLSLKK